MFGNLFKSKTEKEKLIEKRNELLKQAYMLSKTDRVASDRKTAEAEELVAKIDLAEG
ncbi:MAG: Lacal_2735 family protein [Salibacteraceae bacterium]|nr:Lacal_2735 family protein [Salibacteraceae bacterium]|tara:strand:- start:32784 stop:32954 length:171 start_codon:yes stop_codon:yes gene_type:complete